MSPDDTLRAAATLLLRAKRVLAITGAGISADSGLPTYRGVGGLYDGVFTDEGLPIEVALSGEVFRRSPALSWKYIAQVEAACRGAQPNAAHRFLARLQDRADVWVLTQNVDGLHQLAGSRQVIAIHGDVYELRCTHCAWRERVRDYSQLALPPSCPRCAEVVRPDVVLFGEQLPAQALETYHHQLQRGFDIVLSIGTSSIFPYIAQPVLDAAQLGVPSVEINLGDTEVSHAVRLHLRLNAAAACEALAARLGG